MTTESASGVPVVPDSARPLRADAERNRKRIIAAARRLFAERGLDVSLDDVAEEAGVGVGTVYRRFANRDDLVFGVFLDHLKTVAARVGEALEEPDPWVGLVDLMGWVCQLMAEDRGLAAIIMTIDHSNPEIQEVKSEMSDQLARVFDRAMDAGALRPDLAVTDLYGLFTMLTAVAEKTQPVAPGTWRRYLGLVLDSISAEPARTPLGAPPISDEQFEQMRHHAHQNT